MSCIWSTRESGVLHHTLNMKVSKVDIFSLKINKFLSNLSKDINAVNAFVSKLPNLPSRSSIQPMIKKIYTNCMNIRSEERTTENLQILKTILESAREFNFKFIIGHAVILYDDD